FLLEHHVVRGRYDEVGLRIYLCYFVRGIGNTRGRVTANGLQQNLVITQLWQLLFYQALVVAVGYHVNVFGRTDVFEAVHGDLEHAFAYAQHIMKLFREIGTAEWPEATADAARHDNHISVFVHVYMSPSF